jgi:hypothetical protein
MGVCMNTSVTNGTIPLMVARPVVSSLPEENAKKAGRPLLLSRG